MTDSSIDNFFAGLHSIVDDAFPKTCSTCGKVYSSEQEFINDTLKLNNQSGLKQSYDDDDLSIIELYRNCSCGSTLMNFFGDRRGTDDVAEQRRKKFGELHEYLVTQGIEPDIARNELLKVIRGEKSEILNKINLPDK